MRNTEQMKIDYIKSTHPEAKKMIRKEYFETLDERFRLANFLHNKFCNSNHVDGCSWFYEEDGLNINWEGYTHKKYLTKAENILKVISFEQAVNVVKCL